MGWKGAEVLNHEVSEFFVAPCMCLRPGELSNADCAEPEDLKPGDTFDAGPRWSQWVVVDDPTPHDDLICVYAYREKPDPLYHYFYFEPGTRGRMHANLDA